MRASKDEGPYRNRKTRIETDTHAATRVDSGTRQKRDTMPGSASALPTHQTRRRSIKSTRSSLAEGSVGNLLTPAPARLLVSVDIHNTASIPLLGFSQRPLPISNATHIRRNHLHITNHPPNNYLSIQHYLKYDCG